MKKLIAILLSTFLLSIGTANSQENNLSNIPAKKLKSMGKNALQLGDTYSAIDYFSAYCEKKSDPSIMFLLAECHRLSRNYPEAKKWYYQAYTSKPEKNLVALYYYATMLKIEMNYEDAYKEFNAFRKRYNGGDDIDFKKLAKYQMVACDSLAKYLRDSALTIKIDHLSADVNKASIEFAPRYINNNEILYSSLRTDTAVYTIEEGEDYIIPTRKFYTATNKNDNWEFTNEWENGNFSIPNVNVGNGAFSPNKQRFYYTQCSQNWKFETICKIYMSEKKGSKWSEPVELPDEINAKKSTNTQPAVGTDSKKGDEVLYFVSDREGGKGGLDIWYTIYNAKKKEWRSPRNCGTKINGPGDEVTPYYNNKTRTLYFSSNGWPGLGELDVFRNVGELGKWAEKPENVGYPLNSEFDDLYYTILDNGKKGFFTSNRPESFTTLHTSCCDDIYAFEYVEYIDVAVEGKIYQVVNQKIQSILQGKIESTENGVDSTNYIEGAIVALFQIDKKSNETTFISQDTTDSEGKYFFDIEVNKDYVLEFENYLEKSKRVEVTTKGITKSDTLHIDDVGIEYLSKSPFVVKNIYYEFDKYKLTTAAKQTIDSTLLVILKEAPEIIIELSSHTDSKGDDKYNMTLSQNRAESVVNYLIKKGIDKERLYAKGYGEAKPIAPNTNPDGTDNPDGRQKNRRTEFRVIGTLTQYSEIIYEE